MANKQSKPIFNFSDVVVIENNLIGVVVKSWESFRAGEFKGFKHEVYVRSYNGIKEYSEDEMSNFIYDKELTEEAQEYYE